VDDDNGPDAGAAYVFDVTTGQEVVKLLASDGEAGDFFGSSVAISGDTAVIGAPLDDGSSLDAGAAYVFDVTTGQEVAKLLASDGEGGDEFGFRVAISGNTAAIGAGGEDDNGADAGGTYLFDVTTGQEVAKLLASDGEPGDRFGGSVAITDDAVVVGAEGDGDNGAGAGAGYVFDLDDLVVEDSKLLASDGEAIDYFGYSMAIGGEKAVIGSLRGGPLDSGAGYVFDLTTGLEIHSLYATDGVPDDFLGSSVAVSGDLAALGAPGKNASTGAAYAFDLTTGQQLAKFVASDGQAFDRLGSSVALLDDPAVGEVLIVGSPYNSNQNGFSAGAAYVFDPYSGGTEINKLVASDGEDGDRFCRSVAIHGQIAVIGAPGDEGWTGSAYVFNWWSGQEIGKLLALDGDPGDQFGAAVAIHGDIAVIGAVNDDDNGLDAGAAYLFDVNTGQQLAKLLALDGEADDRLGISVAIDGETVVLGASGDKDNGSYSGSAYMFDVNTGQEVAKLLASDGEADSHFGSSVAVGDGGDTILCGASWDDNEHGYNAGAAYVYDLGRGDLVVEDSKLVASDGEAIDYFGSSMAIGGARAVIGSLRGGPINSGAGYVFDLTTGLEVHSLYATDGAPDDLLGSSVAVSGDLAVLGAREKNASTGAAYAFDLATGQQLAKFVASDGQASDRLGSSVALLDDPAVGEVLIVGSPDNSNQNGVGAGAAYVFDPYSGGTEINKLVASDGEDGDGFCHSVAIHGQIAVIGAPGDDNWTGSAYVFNWWHGQEIGKLLASDGDPDDQFGAAVAIHGDIAVIGAWNDDDNGLDAGAAYLFDVTTGQQLTKLLALDGEAGDHLGSSVAIDGETVVLGAKGDKDNGSYSGSAYVFDLGTGQEVAKLLASDGEAESHFGSSVAVGNGGDTILCGANGDDNQHGPNAGAAYVYDLGTGPDCGQTYCEGPANGNEGDLAIDTCSVNGGPGNTLTLSNSPSALFGYPMIASTQGSVNPPGAIGELCVGPSGIGRYNKDLQSTGGSGGYSVDIWNSITGGGGGGIPGSAGGGVLMPGDTWQFQCWNRIGGGSTFSAGLTVTFLP